MTTALLIAVIGCGREEWQAETYPASGSITINGIAPHGAVVNLHPLEAPVDKRGSSPWAIVEPDGSFALSTYEQGDGAPAGEYAVTIRWPMDVTDMSAAMTDRLAGAYSAAEQSQLRVTIEEAENNLPPITLVGVTVQEGAAASSSQAAHGP